MSNSNSAHWFETVKEYLNTLDLPMYISIAKAIKDTITAGELEEGARLPTVRSLAGELGINNGTVARAYQKLEQEGWILTKTGSGTFVKLSSEVAEDIKPKESLDMEPAALPKYYIDLGASTPSAQLFPIEYYKEAMNTVLDRDGGLAFGYHQGLGYLPLRDAICEYLKGLEVETFPEIIQITTGAQQGVDLIARALIRQGDVVYMERPSYTGAIGSFQSHGAILVDIPMDAEGIDVNALENLVRKKHPRLLYVMPNYQSPTGLCYSDARKAELLKLAESYGFYILEDDYLGELSFQGTAKRPIKALDKRNKVIYVKSFSKLFMPGVRLGFTVLPPELLDQSLKAKRLSDISTDGLTQRIFHLYLSSGRWKDYLEYLQVVYSEKHDRMAQALNRNNDIFYFTAPQGGLTYWVSYQPVSMAGSHISIPARRIARLAMEKGLRVLPGEPFYIHHREENKFRLGFANAKTDEIDKGIDMLAEIIRSAR
jgi:DNA-binding transcriptional MocR family regulator